MRGSRRLEGVAKASKRRTRPPSPRSVPSYAGGRRLRSGAAGRPPIVHRRRRPTVLHKVPAASSAVVGGVAIRGGAGTLLGIALGALTLLVIKNGLTLVRVDPLWLQGVYGIVILGAVGIDAAIARSGTVFRQGAPK